MFALHPHPCIIHATWESISQHQRNSLPTNSHLNSWPNMLVRIILNIFTGTGKQLLIYSKCVFVNFRSWQFGILVCGRTGAGSKKQDCQQGRASHWPLHSLPDWGIPRKTAVVNVCTFLRNYKPSHHKSNKPCHQKSLILDFSQLTAV